jgi:hypothetical protein
MTPEQFAGSAQGGSCGGTLPSRQAGVDAVIGNRKTSQIVPVKRPKSNRAHASTRLAEFEGGRGGNHCQTGPAMTERNLLLDLHESGV